MNLRPYQKFQPQKKRIEELEKISPRFKRVFSEYQVMSEELWNLENAEGPAIPDEFLNAVKLQTIYLEEEIEDWLINDTESQ